MKEQIDRAAQALQQATALLITAGAGMGVDSGLPDFRGTQGFWRAYPAAARLGLSFEQLASPRWFRHDPALAWAFYGHRLELYRRTEPHAGFAQLLSAAAQKPFGYFVFTSNVDGHFQKAGYASHRVVECHGSIHHFQCCTPCSENIWDASEEAVTVDSETFRAQPPLPKCGNCADLARPNILMFDDGAWIDRRTAQQYRLFREWLEEVRRAKARLVVIELGAGTSVPTVRHMSEEVTVEMGADLIRINPRESAVPRGQLGLALGARKGLSAIVPQKGA